MKTKSKKAEKPAAKKTKKAPVEEKTLTMRAHVMERIAAGDTNQEIIDGLADAGFELEPSKRGYIAWYRWDAVRKGLVTKKFATEHAGDRVTSGDEKPAKAKKGKAAPVKAKKGKKAAEVEEEPEEEDVEVEDDDSETEDEDTEE